MKPINRLRATSLVQFALALGLASQNIATADVVFSESFESPVVSGFQSNTIPDNGNWIGSSGPFNSSVRGLYNDLVAWPDTPKFTTPYGNQGYYLGYSTTMLTTAQGATGQTITAGVTYTLTFNAAFEEGTSANYKAHLVAFDVGDDNDARKNSNSMAGTIVAEVNGAITASDMSDSVSVVYSPDGSDPHLGKELAIRFDDGDGDALYDNVRLIVGHDYAPNPASGEDLSAAGNITLSWTNMPPEAPATETYVDILFGTDPEALNLAVDGQLISSTIVSAPTAGTYYWRIDSYPDGDPNGTPVSSSVNFFTIADTDADGLPDDYEEANATNPASPTANTDLDPASDLDSDELTAAEEYYYGTDPNDPDSDEDTLLDGPEVNGTAGARPATNPLVIDTDEDGFSDLVETNTGSWSSASDTGTNPADPDTDNDGLKDGAETNTGNLVDRFDAGTNPHTSDTDLDGVGDYYEVVAAGTDPSDDQDLPSVPYPLPDPDPSDLGLSEAPVKVYIMSGQSNMVGIGYINSNEPGSLNSITRSDNKFPNLIDDSGAFTSRNDVIYKGVVTADANNGPLTINQGGGNDRVGVELGFGHVMGYYHGEPVLLIKASQGNRSLAWDYAPPGSPRFDFDGTTYAGYGDTDSSWPAGGDPDAVLDWYCGKEYDQAFLDESDWAAAGQDDAPLINAADVLDFETGTLNNLPTEGNNLNGRSFEIAGFVWWQGHKDGGEDRTGTAGAYATQYEQRLERLINELRSEFNAPTAPFVVATIGFGGGGWDPGSSGDVIYNAQLDVSNPTLYPAFENNVGSVDTTGYWRPASESPGGQGFHYMNNAETYTLVGDAMARRMIELVELAESNDTLPPAITSTTPADDAVEISAGINLEATFNDNIAIGTGNITLVNLTAGSGNIVIDVTDSSQVSVASTGFSLIIDPSVNLSDSTEYAVQLDAGSIVDDAGNSFAGISDTTTWSFTTAFPDTVAPTLVTLNPDNGTADVLPSTNLEATFSEPIKIGAGNITLVDTDDGSDTLVIAVTDSTQITIDDDTLIINPTVDFADETSYAVQIDATAIDDLVGNSYAGISDTTSWTFTTPLPGVVFSDDFEAPDVDGYNITNTSGQASSDWVRATNGYGASRNGVVDAVYEGTWTAPGGQQAYAFRYTNSGVTTANGIIGSLTAGTTITVSFDVFTDGFNGGDSIKMSLVTFNGGTRNDISSGMLNGTSSYLAELSVSAPATGFQRYALGYTVGADVIDADGAGSGSSTTFDSAVLGHDIAIRFDGASSAASIDNVLITIISDGGGGGDSFANWISGYSVGDLTAPGDDFDGDGVPNAAENYFGTDPSSFSAGLTTKTVELAGNTTFSFSHPISDTPAADLSAVYKWSTDLSTFHGDGVSANGTTVTFTPGAPTDGEVTVSAEVTGTDPGKIFVIIDVTQNP